MLTILSSLTFMKVYGIEAPIQAVEWTNEESKAGLCPNICGCVTNPWLLRSEQRMNKWRGEELRTHSSKEERQAGAESTPTHSL